MRDAAIRGVLFDQLAWAFAAGENWLRSTEATSSRDDYDRVILAELGVAPTDELLAELWAPLDVPVFEAFPEAAGVLGRLREAGVKLAIVTNSWETRSRSSDSSRKWTSASSMPAL